MSRRKVFTLLTGAVTKQLQYRDLDCLVVADVADGKILLPKAIHEARGMRVTAFVKTASSSVGLVIEPSADDTILGLSLAPSAGGGIKNTAATDAVGDTITLECDGAGLWVVTGQRGTWAAV